MSRSKLLVPGILAAVLAFATPAYAATITFGISSLDNLAGAGSQSEAGFTYTAVGAGWELQTLLSNPGAALSTFFNDQGATNGSTVTFALTGGGLFTFDSLQWATFNAGAADDVIVEGFLGAALVGSVALTSSSLAYQTQLGFAGEIDSLRIRVTSGGQSSAMAFDNLVVTPAAVPEPGTLLLLGAGIAALVARRRLLVRS